MSEDKDMKQFSEAMTYALSELEKFEFEFSIEEPKAKKFEGRFVGHLRDKGRKPS